jgi:mannose-6-phosphate isomerase-like protein (cupin superfamily)
MLKLPEFKFDYKDFENYFTSKEAFENKRSFYIDKNGKDVIIESETYEAYLAITQIKLIEQQDTLKIEGIEKLCGFEHGTVHAFRYWKNSPSFDTHTDPVHVIVEVKKGWKIMDIDRYRFNIPEGNAVDIPAGTPHKALNEKEGLMFSYGLYDF